MAADESGTWRRLLTDPDTGHLLDIGERRYRPSPRLRDYINARDDICTFPACNQPGYRCDYEHIAAFGQGGKTCRSNGALACRRHNNCKVNTGWAYALNPDGSFTWTTDTGHSYPSHPPERWRPGREREVAECDPASPDDPALPDPDDPALPDPDDPTLPDPDDPTLPDPDDPALPDLDDPPF